MDESSRIRERKVGGERVNTIRRLTSYMQRLKSEILFYVSSFSEAESQKSAGCISYARLAAREDVKILLLLQLSGDA